MKKVRYLIVSISETVCLYMYMYMYIYTHILKTLMLVFIMRVGGLRMEVFYEYNKKLILKKIYHARK